jgi:hypothetical protein
VVEAVDHEVELFSGAFGQAVCKIDFPAGTVGSQLGGPWFGGGEPATHNASTQESEGEKA